MPTRQQIADTKRRREARVAECSHCHRELPWEDFCPSPSRRPFGLASQCKSCDRDRKARQKRHRYWADHERSLTDKRDKNLQRKFGITAAQYDQMVEAQDGRCAICGETETYVHHATRKTARLAVDHCHTTNRVRALLCGNCNKGLGCFRDNPEHLAEAIKYLETHSK